MVNRPAMGEAWAAQPRGRVVFISWLLPGLGKFPGPPHKASGLGFGCLLGEELVICPTPLEYKESPRNGCGGRNLRATLTREEPQHLLLRPPSVDTCPLC